MTNDGAKRAIAEAFYSELRALKCNSRVLMANDGVKKVNIALPIISRSTQNIKPPQIYYVGARQCLAPQ